MFDLLNKFIPSKPDASKTWKIEESKQVQIALCALLVEVAKSDKDFSPEEKIQIIKMLSTYLELNDQETEQLIVTADLALKEEHDIWAFSNILNQNFSVTEREKIMELVWKVIYTDKNMNQYENYMAHKIANLLRLSHKQLIDTKMKVKQETNCRILEP